MIKKCKVSLFFLLYFAALRANSVEWFKNSETYNLLKKNKNTQNPREFYERFISPGSLVFDIGANVGLYAREYLASGARVICVEPQATCAQSIREAFIKNNDVIVVEKGVAEKPGRLPLYICSAEKQDIDLLRTGAKKGQICRKRF